MVPFWIASVAKIGALPIVNGSKSLRRLSVTLSRQLCCVNGVFCNTKRPVDATVSKAIRKEFVIAIATGQCDLRNDAIRASGLPGVM